MSRPGWVVKELSEILGFDTQTVIEAILPDLEGNTSQVKLKSHLQDFLGVTPRAKAFVERYISFRFPSIVPGPSTSGSGPGASLPGGALEGKVVPGQPRFGSVGSVGLGAGNQSLNGRTTPGLGGVGLGVGYRLGGSAQGEKGMRGLAGGQGSVYLKNREADESNPTPSGSASRSGSNTPHSRAEVPRSAGAVTYTEAKSKPRLESRNGSGSGSGNRETERGGGEKIWDLPKSKEVKRLEDTIEKLRVVQGEGKVAKEEQLIPDCFCQARVHPLSLHTPHCSNCGLVVCILHPVHLPCPSCQNLLYSPAGLSRLIMRLQAEIEAQLDKEQSLRDQRERDRRDRLIAESGGGAFPSLSAPTPGTTPSAQGENARKVLTIGGGKGKGKAILTTTIIRPAPAGAPPGATTQVVVPGDIVPKPREGPLDLPRIEKELNKVLKWREEEDRPWGDLKLDKKGDGWSYVELPVAEVVDDALLDGRRRQARKKKNAQANGQGKGENGRLVPGAA